jgi:Rrf2 family protein
MPLIFSKSCEYAIQAVLFLAKNAHGRPMLLQDISTGLEIPHHFLGKVMQRLSRDGIVESHKGANGGFNLKRPPHQIALNDIVQSVDGESFLNCCVLGFPRCDECNPCPSHPQWKRAKKTILEMLNRKTLAVLGKAMDGRVESAHTKRGLKEKRTDDPSRARSGCSLPTDTRL